MKIHLRILMGTLAGNIEYYHLRDFAWDEFEFSFLVASPVTTLIPQLSRVPQEHTELFRIPPCAS